MSEWEAYDRLEPIGKERDEAVAALNLSILINYLQSIFLKKGTYKWVQPEDFTPEWGKEPPEETEPKQQSVEEMKSVLFSIARRFGKKEGVDKHGPRNPTSHLRRRPRPAK